VPIPESQLETWSHQGAVTTAKATADSIKNALNSYKNWLPDVDFEIYLQGSYKNDTNIRGDSDVDVVIQLNSTFYNNLSQEQKRILSLSAANYGWPEFKPDVLKALRSYYGASSITEGNKSVKISAGNGRLPADVVVCSKYRKYKTLNSSDCIEGMCFWTQTDNRQVINYPRLHYDNGVSKHQISTKWYKPTVRMFKNMRGAIKGDSTPSYFTESLLYNVPNTSFGASYQDTFCNIVNWLNKATLSTFVCGNGQLPLFESSPQERWSTPQAEQFIKNLISLWNNWSS
jgi:hypothetical protein